MESIRVTHNGEEIERFETGYDADVWINGFLKKYENLNPEKIFDKCTTLDNGKLMQVIIYRYKTLYQEIFTIERRDG